MGNSAMKAKQAKYYKVMKYQSDAKIEEPCEFFVQPGADVNDRNARTGKSLLMYAVLDGSLECVNTLITAGADVNERDPRTGRTLLMYAAQNRLFTDRVKLLLAAGADVNATSTNGRTALMDAVISSCMDNVQALITAGADVNMKCKYGRTALGYAMNYWRIRDCTNVLIDAGADVNTTGLSTSELLIQSVKTGNDRIVGHLLQGGVDVNTIGLNTSILLMKAVTDGNDRIVRHLLQAGADVNMGGSNTLTSQLITKAVHIWNDKVLAQLVQAGAHVNIPSPGMSQLLFDAVWEGYYKIVNLLIEAGADVNQNPEHGTTNSVIAHAVHAFHSRRWQDFYQCKIKCIQILLKAGAHVNKQTGPSLLTSYITSPACRLERQQDDRLGRLLYAAGETVDWPSLERWDDETWGFTEEWEEGPEWLKSSETKHLCLKDLCRVSIRNNLLHLDLYSNLFIRVPKLGLPAPTTHYLLYNVALDAPSSEEEDNANSSCL